MSISLQNIDKVSALLTVKVEKADYQKQVDQSLKQLRKKAQVPGFRQGMVPMSLIQKMYGKSVLADEINKLIPELLFGYIRANNIKLVGDPLPSQEKLVALDFDTMEDFEFVFDLALAPEVNLEIDAKDEVDYYTIEITDELLEQQTKSYTQRNGRYDKVESYEEPDMLKGLLTELDDAGNPKDGGISVEGAVMMPSYMKAATQKNKFKGAKLNDILTFNPHKAYKGHDAELASLLHIEKEAVADMKSDFSFQIEEITRFVDGELTQEFFDQTFGEGVVKSEEEFRAKVKEGVEKQFAENSEYRFIIDARKVLLDKLGRLQFSDVLLKRMMMPEEGELSDENYEKNIEELTWHLVKEKLVSDFAIKVEHDEVLDMAKSVARAQFAQYGMLSLPDDILENYSREILSKKESIDDLIGRVLSMKIAEQLKGKMKLNKKTISLEDFNNLYK